MTEEGSKDEQPGTGRRQWIALVAGGVAAVGGFGWLVVRSWLPWITVGPDGRWRIGPRARFPEGSVTLLKRARAVVVHDALGIRALSAVCTHEGCLVHDTPSRRELICPCHGAAFDYQGNALRGPAKRPLSWLEVKEEAGELLLDPSRKMPGPDAL